MKISSKLLTVLVLMLALASCAPKNGELTKAQMREDVAYFFTSFLETHPNPYCRATPKQVDSIKTALLQKIDKGLPKEEFLNELGKLNGLLDGHSYIESPLLVTSKNDSLLFPPVVEVNTDRSLSLDGTLLPPGNTITSINGISSYEILKMMGKKVNSDRGVLNKEQIERNFPALLKRCSIHSPFLVKAQTTNGDTSLTIKGCYPTNFSIFHRSLGSSNYKELDSGIFQHSKIAILYFNTCEPKNAEKFRREIDSFFTTIQKQGIKYLFIDNSRNNGGRSSWGEYLISKINHGKYHYTFRAQIKKSEASDRVKRNRTDNGLAGTFNKTFPSVTNGYSGKVYMLLSNNTFSSGSTTAWQFRFAKVGKILGDKSGSANPMYVYPAEFTLPNSKLNFRISVREGGYVTAQGKKMAYLKEPEPDVPFNINPFKTSYSEQELLALLKLANKQ